MSNPLTSFFEDFEEVPNAKNEKILLIDANNLFHRVLHVAIYHHPDDNINGFLIWKNMVIESIFGLIKKFNPTKVYFAIDSRNYWRRDIYPEYKAQRKEVRDNSKVNFEEFFKVLNDFTPKLKEIFTNFYVLEIPRCEADDIIATVVIENSKYLENEMIVVSTDKDFHQLQVFKNMKQYDPINKEFKKSINPTKDLELKILMGDRGDNIFAVKPKCGIKTAEKMLDAGLIELNDETIKNKYLLNKRLIDFKQIPIEIKEKILNEIKEYKIEKLDMGVLWSWLLKMRVNKVADEIQHYRVYLENIQ